MKPWLSLQRLNIGPKAYRSPAANLMSAQINLSGGLRKR